MRTKYFERHAARAGALLCGLGINVLAMPLQSQQPKPAAPLPPVTPAAVDAIAFLDKAALQQDAALQGKISLEARRMPLRELLAEAQKQGGIALQATADSPAVRALMTARLKDMTLATLMLSLARIYDVRWAKDGAAYTMHASDNDELSYRMIRYQGQNWTYTTVPDREIRNREGDVLAEAIFHSIDKTIWGDNETVLVSALPAAMQERLRRRFELEGLKQENLLERLERIYATQTLHLRLHMAREKTPSFRPGLFGEMELNQSLLYKMPRLMAYNAEGRFIAALFPEFHGPKQPFRPPPDQIRPLSEAPLANNAAVAPQK